MSDPILSSITESEGPQSYASSFGSMKDGSLSVEDMEYLIQKLRNENKALQLRVLGVNELARLLQDRNEAMQVLQEKNKRLEVALVRLENRCANLEQKQRSEGGPMSGPRSGQAPFIPGPSRQILEALMKENAELKKALNNLQKKGASGYLEAVKTTQLEEVIDQQKQDLQFLRGQINTLTSTPTSSVTLAEEDKSQSGDSALGSISQSAPQAGGSGSPGSLRRQLIKMQHSLKVKDRFCSLLSEQVASLQERLNKMHLETPEPPETEGSTSVDDQSLSGHMPKQTTDQENESPYIPSSTAREEHPQIEELKAQLIKQKEEMEGKYKHLMEEQKETLKKERQEHMSLVEKLQEKEQEVKKKTREYDALDQRCEDLSFHVHTLLEDKKKLSDDLAEARRGGPRESGGSKQLEKELRDLQSTLDQKVKDHLEEVKSKNKELQHLQMMLEDTQYKYAIAESRMSTIVDEHKQQMSDLSDKLDEKYNETSAKQNEIEELKYRNQHLQLELNNIKSRISTPPTYTRPPFPATAHCERPDLVVPPHLRNVQAVRDGPKQTQIDPTVMRPTNNQLRCGPNQVDDVFRGVELVSRGVDDVPPPPSTTAQQSHPSSLPFRTTTTQTHLTPSPSTMATPHTAPPPGRRSPVAGAAHVQPQPPRPGHPAYTPHTQHPPAMTPSGVYYPSVPGYPQRPPQQAHRYPQDPTHPPVYMYPQGPNVRPTQPPTMPPRDTGLPPHGAGERGTLPPGHPSDPSTSPQHHHYHHPPRRN